MTITKSNDRDHLAGLHCMQEFLEEEEKNYSRRFFWGKNVWDKSESKTISETVKITWTVIWHNQIVVSQRNCLHILCFAFSLKSNNKHFVEMSRRREHFMEMWTLVVCNKKPFGFRHIWSACIAGGIVGKKVGT